MIPVRNAVSELEEYYVLQDQSVVKLNQNESSYDVPPELKKEILMKLDSWKWNRYAPMQATSLVNAISQYTNFPTSGIVVGNGSNEIIQAILFAFCEAKDKILVISPGFSIYPRVAKIMGLEIVDVPLLQQFQFDTSSIISKSKDVRLIILASPNNPTGTALSLDEIEQIAKNFDGVFVVDEAYFEFHQKTAQDFITKYQNMILIRTLSKAFSLASLRIGYLLAMPEIAKQIEKAKLPFSVGIFQQVAGEILLKNRQPIIDIADTIIKQRDHVFSKLNSISSVHPIPSSTNFILFEVREKSAKEVFNLCYQKGVLLRYFGSERLKNYLRVTIGTPDENKIFLDKLQDILCI